MSATPSPLPPFLFSVDLEDIRQLVPEGDQLRDRVEATTEQILAFLERHDARCTFFTTGDVARRYPGLVKRIAAAGHEIGCHSSEHIPLDRQDGASFRADLEACLDAYARAGVERVQGYRAPIASLTARTRWAYGVLRELGFRYSASVLAARNPLYGWPDFGPDRPTRMDGLWELPVSLVALPGEDVTVRDGDVYIGGDIARKPSNVQSEMWMHVFDSLFMPRRQVEPLWDLAGVPERWTRDPWWTAMRSRWSLSSPPGSWRNGSRTTRGMFSTATWTSSARESSRRHLRTRAWPLSPRSSRRPTASSTGSRS